MAFARPGGYRAGQRVMHDPVMEISRVVDVAPTIRNSALDGETRLTGRWTHCGIHASHAPMNAHVVITYHGTAQPIELRDGRQRLASRTRRGSLTLIPRGHAAHWDIDGPIDVSHVYLSDARLQSVADGPPIELLDRVGFDDPAGSRLLEILAREATASEGLPRLFLEQALDLLSLHLVRAHSLRGALPARKTRRGLADWQVRRVSEFMKEHLDGDVSLDELAGVVRLSRFHFCTAFRRATGQTPYQWLTALRMERARDLLRDPDTPVVQVALAVGYETPSAFAAAFRRTQSVSPSEYRQAL